MLAVFILSVFLGMSESGSILATDIWNWQLNSKEVTTFVPTLTSEGSPWNCLVTALYIDNEALQKGIITHCRKLLLHSYTRRWKMLSYGPTVVKKCQIWKLIDTFILISISFVVNMTLAKFQSLHLHCYRHHLHHQHHRTTVIIIILIVIIIIMIILLCYSICNFQQ